MLKRILHIHSYFKVCAREAQHDCCFASMWFQFVVIAVPGSKLAIGHIFFPQIFFFFYGYWITDYSLPVTWCHNVCYNVCVAVITITILK